MLIWEEVGGTLSISLQSAGSIPVGTTRTTVSVLSLYRLPHPSHRSILLSPSSYTWGGRAGVQESDCKSAFGGKAYGCKWPQAVTVSWYAQLHLYPTREAGTCSIVILGDGRFSLRVRDAYTGNCFLVCWDLANLELFLLPIQNLLAS